MNIKEFEELKDRKSKLSILKAKEEAKIENLNKELTSIMSELSSFGVNSIEDAKLKLEELEKEYEQNLASICEMVKELDNVQLN